MRAPLQRGVVAPFIMKLSILATQRSTQPERSCTLAVLLLACATVAQAAAEADTWPLAGQQGLTRLVIVPLEQSRDRAAYARQIGMLCEPQRTCFLNFYTNSTGAPASLPLSDAIAKEATAVFRRSMKRGVDIFTWSCRLQVTQEACF
jgi:hypothetical protein